MTAYEMRISDWSSDVCSSDLSMQLRILLSSENSGRNFDLRCRVREGVIAFIAREFPHALPHLRAELLPGEAATKPPPPPPIARSAAPASSPTPTRPESG